MRRNLLKKFRGFIFPEQFIPHYQHIHKKRHSSFLGNVIGLRQPAHVVTLPSKEKEIYHERIVYVGCVHGGNDDIYDRLHTLAKYPPDYLIFTGDITGSPEIERLKKHFYEEKDKNPHGPLKEFEYFGNWAFQLPQETRGKLLSNLEENAYRLLKIIQKIKTAGSQIFIVEGNWDNPAISGINYIAGNNFPKVFDSRTFFEHHGFPFIKNLEILETKTSLHIFLPYIVLLHLHLVSKFKIRQIKRQILQARYEDKTIIMVGHAEANWKIHHLFIGTKIVHGERAHVINNFAKAMYLFQPDEVIYPHQHARLRDEKGNLLDKNAKYLFQIEKSGVRLINGIQSLNPNHKQIVTTYIPFCLLAEEDFIRV